MIYNSQALCMFSFAKIETLARQSIHDHRTTLKGLAH